MRLDTCSRFFTIIYQSERHLILNFLLTYLLTYLLTRIRFSQQMLPRCNQIVPGVHVTRLSSNHGARESVQHEVGFIHGFDWVG